MTISVAKLKEQIRKIAETSQLTFNEVRVILAIERLIARIASQKVLSDRIVFKGGFALFKLVQSRRFTHDLDAIVTNTSVEQLIELVREALQIDLKDGFSYYPPEVVNLQTQGEYGGHRFIIPFQIKTNKETANTAKLSRIHLDIGMGDVIIPSPKAYPLSLLLPVDPPISWRAYPLEAIFAEKLQTLVVRESGNSRAKDFYDLSILFPRVGQSSDLARSIQATFKNRGTKLPSSFADFLAGLDFSILKPAWGSVELITTSLDFDDCITTLRKQMTSLDKLLA